MKPTSHAYSPGTGLLLWMLLATAGASWAHGPDFTQIVSQAGPAVVNIRALVAADSHLMPNDEHHQPGLLDRFFGDPDGPPMMEAMSTGSGFIISPDGMIVTNWHVIDGAREIRVRLNDRREFVAAVVGRDLPTDIALLRIDGEDLPVVSIGSAESLKVGDWVVAIGSPFNFDNSVTAGILSAKGRSFAQQQYVPFLQTDVPINRGNSGGPLLDMDGRVVAVNSQIFSENGTYMGLSFSIPIDIAMAVVNQLAADGHVARGLLGIGIEDVTRELADSLGLVEPRGAIVTFVSEGSAAATAGLQPWDVVLAVDEQAIKRYSELPPRVGMMEPGSTARLTIWRDGRAQQVEAVIGGYDDGDEAPAAVEATTEPAEYVTLPHLGLELEPRESGEGLEITAIHAPTVWRAGLRRGDIIHGINRARVNTLEAFDAQVEAAGERPLALLVQRGSGFTFVTVPPRS